MQGYKGYEGNVTAFGRGAASGMWRFAALLCASAALLTAGCEKMHPPVESKAEPPPPQLTAEMIVEEREVASAITLGLANGVEMPVALKTQLEAAMAAATEQDAFTINTISQPEDVELAEWLAGDEVPDLVLAHHVDVVEFPADLLRSINLSEWLYLAVGDAAISRKPAADIAETNADVAAPSIQPLPDSFFDPAHDPVAASELGDPSQGKFLPFLYTAMGLAAATDAPATLTLDSWSTLFTADQPAEALPRLVPADRQPLYWAALLSNRKSPNSVAAADYAEASALLLASAPAFSPVPPGYNVPQALEQRKAAIALIFGNELSVESIANGRVNFAIPQEGTVRQQLDFVVPAAAKEVTTVFALLAKLQQPELMAAAAQAFGMTPSRHPKAWSLLVEQGAPVICLLPQNRQYYDPQEGIDQKRAREALDRQLIALLVDREATLPALGSVEEAVESAQVAPETPAMEDLPLSILDATEVADTAEPSAPGSEPVPSPEVAAPEVETSTPDAAESPAPAAE